MLRLHRSLEPYDATEATRAEGLALAIGNFDGVHRGHGAILSATRDAALAHRLVPAAMSFEPLPREHFSRVRSGGAAPPARLMTLSEKLAQFSRAGIELAFVPRFDTAFASQSADQFISRLADLRVRWLMVGEDFHFGSRRSGDVAMLKAAGARHDFSVTTVADTVADGHRISSTAVREALREGRLSDARVMLGRPYAITGRVTHGRKLGRTLGFPTANISLGCAARRRNPALNGVFAVKCQLVTRGLEGVAGGNGTVLNGVANLGTNPVVSSENRHHLEVFLFDFSGDLYGRRLEVAFIEKIRDEQKFAGLEALVKQMHDDTARAKTILRIADDGPEN